MIAKKKTAAGRKRKAKPARRLNLPLKGGCHCGALRYRVTAAPKDSGYCHCYRLPEDDRRADGGLVCCRRRQLQLCEGRAGDLQILGLGAAGILRRLRLPDPVPAAKAGADGERQRTDPGQAGGGAAAAAYL